MNARVFSILGILQSVSLGMSVYLLFRSLNAIQGENLVGLDTAIVLSTAFPLFLLLVAYTIYTKK